MRSILFVLILIFSFSGITAQSFIFGPKFGPSIGLQKWDNFERDPLFAFHAAAFIESYEEDNPSSLFAQIGYHVRGSATRYLTLNSSFTQNFKFNNVALILGGRRVFNEGPSMKSYYLVGLRAEYTVSTNLDEFRQFQTLIYPTNDFVKKFNYGFHVGAGLEFPFSEFIGGILELSINPDISKQYDQPPIDNVVDPWNPGNLLNLRKREIRNVTVDLTLGIRFLRKVIYVD